MALVERSLLDSPTVEDVVEQVSAALRAAWQAQVDASRMAEQHAAAERAALHAYLNNQNAAAHLGTGVSAVVTNGAADAEAHGDWGYRGGEDRGRWGRTNRNAVSEHRSSEGSLSDAAQNMALGSSGQTVRPTISHATLPSVPRQASMEAPSLTNANLANIARHMALGGYSGAPEGGGRGGVDAFDFMGIKRRRRRRELRRMALTNSVWDGVDATIRDTDPITLATFRAGEAFELGGELGEQILAAYTLAVLRHRLSEGGFLVYGTNPMGLGLNPDDLIELLDESLHLGDITLTSGQLLAEGRSALDEFAPLDDHAIKQLTNVAKRNGRAVVYSGLGDKKEWDHARNVMTFHSHPGPGDTTLSGPDFHQFLQNPSLPAVSGVVYRMKRESGEEEGTLALTVVYRDPLSSDRPLPKDLGSRFSGESMSDLGGLAGLIDTMARIPTTVVVYTGVLEGGVWHMEPAYSH